MTTPINVPNMCQKHQYLLVTQAGVPETGPWRALIIMAQVTLFQLASCDDAIHARIGGDITRMSELGCLACLKPDAFGEVVQAAEIGDFGAIKALGDAAVAASRAQ